MARTDFIGESFKRRADSSAFFEAFVGATLSRSNLWSVHHPFTLAAETGKELSFYAHSWDLDVSPDNKVFHPVEVKSVNLNFTSPDDYPHRGILVCSEASWRNKWQDSTVTNRDFLMVSRVNGSIVWLPKGAPVGRTEVTDKTRGETYWCITTHKNELRTLRDFVTHIQSHCEPWTS